MLDHHSTKASKRQLRSSTALLPASPAKAGAEEKTRPRKRPPPGVVPLTHSEDEAAIRAGCGRTTIRKAIDAGDLVSIKMFGRTAIRDADLIAWIDSLPVRAPKPKVAA